jgi:hypothetical protein
MTYKRLHRCCVCHEPSEDDGEDMAVFSSRTRCGDRRRWKHFKCLTFGEMEALKPGDARRFEAWRLDYRSELRAAAR